MVTNVQGFNKITVSQEDAADFSVGADDPIVQWYANQPCEGKNAIPATGWYIAKGAKENGSLETAITAYNVDHADNPFRLAKVKHDQSKKVSEDWIFPEELSFFVLCRGVREPFADKAIVSCYAYRWGEKAPDGKKESKLYVRAVIADLMVYGYNQPVQLRAKAKGRTQGLMRCLSDQQRALAEYKKLSGDSLPYWGFSLPIGAAEINVGNADVSKDMYVPTSFIPGKITTEYLQEHFVGNYPDGDVLNSMLSATFKESVEWATQTTKALLRGFVDTRENTEAPSEESGNAPEFGGYGDGEPPEYTENGYVRKGTTEASEPALQGQRDGLRRLGMTLQRPDLIELAESPNLTKAVAGQAILFAQQKRNQN